MALTPQLGLETNRIYQNQRRRFSGGALQMLPAFFPLRCYYPYIHPTTGIQIPGLARGFKTATHTCANLLIPFCQFVKSDFVIRAVMPQTAWP